MSRQMIQAAKGMICPKPTMRFVALILADAHNAETGQCNPSVSAIMSLTGFSNRPVCKALQDLEKEGHLKAIRGFGARNSYILHFKTSDAGSRVTDEEPVTLKTQPVTQGRGSGIATSDGGSCSNMTLKTGPVTLKTETSDAGSHNREGKDREEKGKGKKVSNKELANQEINQACSVELDSLASDELKSLWQEWQRYRYRMATSPAAGQKKVHWTAQAANIAAKNMQAWHDKHGIQAITTSIQRAIETAGKWISFFEPMPQFASNRTGTKLPIKPIEAIDVTKIPAFNPEADICPF